MPSERRFSERTNWKLVQNRFTQAVEEARARGVSLLDLTASNPTRVGLKYDSQTILSALASPHSLDYDAQSKGLLSARQAVSSYYRDEHQVCDLDAERIVLTTSTSEGYSHVFRLLCSAGDELLVPKPSYPLFEFLADLQDVKLVPYPLLYDHGWQIDFPSMESAVTERTKGVVVVHPNNPTGSHVHGEELASLNAFCRKHSLAVIADEVFLDYQLLKDLASGEVQQDCRALLDRTAGGGQPQMAFGSPLPRASSFAANRDVLTFTLSGVSKISALPQMKVAWVITSGPAKDVEAATARLEVIADTYLSMNAPIQWAVPVLLDQRKSIQRQLMERVRANLEELDRQLAHRTACERLDVEGGWYAVLRVPVTRSDEELAIELIREKSVLVHPGHFYDFPTDGYLILSLISSREEFAQGIRLVLEKIES